MIVLLTAAIAPALTGIGLMTTGVGNLMKGFEKLSPKIKAVWGVINANPISRAITLISVLVGGLVTLYNKCKWFRDLVDPILDWIKDKVEKIVGFFEDLFSFGDKKSSGKSKKKSSKKSRSVNPLSLRTPSMPITWYAKGGILNRPTIFGANGSTLMGGGEAGKEAVLPIDLLKSYIREENSRNNGIMAQILSEVIKDLQIVAENNIYLGDTKLVSVMTDMILDKMGQKHRAYRAAKGE